MNPERTFRCAIYTRVSTDAGLEQDFNSLDAQREASEAYIKSQTHEGWKLIRTAYDDGGYSGGNMERPALQKLLADVKGHLIDVILVYKVDRLTRSLSDFAKLVELFDAHSVSFVSVTQAFNTTTSMGRLTLNVLLSFAQFEREVTAERIRDKIAASKKKGIWMGGSVPLGYRVQDRKLLVEAEEAKIVKMIFERYLALGSLLPLLTELNDKGVRTRTRLLSSGRKVGGVPFTRGPLAFLLRNRVYLGEINHHGQSYPAEHPPIIDREIFDKVQAQLTEHLRVFHAERKGYKALLKGKLLDSRGNSMSPTHTQKGAAHYRYYYSRVLIEGRRPEAGEVKRVSTTEIEELVLAQLGPFAVEGLSGEELIATYVKSVTVKKGTVEILLNPAGVEKAQTSVLSVAWRPKPIRVKREILLPHNDPGKDNRPIRAERRQRILHIVGKARLWLQGLIDGSIESTEQLATQEKRSKRSINMTLSLAFLSPEIVEAIAAGRIPRGIGPSLLMDLPPIWSEQRESLGLYRGPRNSNRSP